MDITLSFDRLLAHDHWANGQTLASVEALADPPGKARELAGHVLGAEQCWLQRMTAGRDPADWERWESADLATLRQWWRDELPPLWAAFLADRTLCDPARTCSYVSYLGNTCTANVQDALVQLMLHGSYHRGQIASLVRAAGGEPAVTDFMHAARRGVL